MGHYVEEKAAYPLTSANSFSKGYKWLSASDAPKEA